MKEEMLQSELETITERLSYLYQSYAKHATDSDIVAPREANPEFKNFLDYAVQVYQAYHGNKEIEESLMKALATPPFAPNKTWEKEFYKTFYAHLSALENRKKIN